MGGRYKVFSGLSAISCTQAEVAEAHAAQERKKLQETSRLKLLNAATLKARGEVDSFLTQHGFDGVNAGKLTACGLRRTYPLHEAAKRHDWHMICLLLQFGADPLQQDSRGRTFFSFGEPPAEVRRCLGQPCAEQKA
mmetsp:Transcript_32505/g.75131  ORF Transcript_32505/g.75131 Transcript_32505/m.75131 type:complete len:137 (-) Transcript_32505:622-1032(-)